MMIRNMRELMTAAKSEHSCRMAVACAQDAAVLDAVFAAMDQGLVVPILVGDEEEIRKIGEERGFPINSVCIENIPDKSAACMRAAALVRDGDADLLMKGLVDTSHILKAILSRDNMLRTDRQISHVLMMELPDYDRLLCVTDSAMIVAPTLEQKVSIVKNAVQVFHALGNICPKVAALCAVEKVNPKMACTLDAAELTRMNREGEITGCLIDGPLALDNAVSKEAAEHKGIKSQVAGYADVLLAPDIEAGNILNKSMEYFGCAKKAGVIMGAKVPVVLTSRATAAESKLFSIALGALIAVHNKEI